MTIVIPDGTPTSLDGWAMLYGKAGLYLAPTSATGVNPFKNPGTLMGSAWQTRTITGGADAYAWFGEGGEFHGKAVGVGFQPGRSDIVLIDIDDEDSSLWPAEVRKAIEEEQPPHFTSRKGGIARGSYLFATGGVAYGNGYGTLSHDRAKSWGDVRGAAGFSVLPGSQHAKPEGLYEWKRRGAVPLLPAYLAEKLGARLEDSACPLSDSLLSAFLDAHVSEMKAGALKGQLSAFEQRKGRGRHTEMTSVLTWAFKEAVAGLYPARRAYADLRAAFVGAVADRATSVQAGSEFESIAAWAAGNAAVASAERLADITNRTLPGREVLTDDDGVKTVAPVLLPAPSSPMWVAEELMRQRKAAGMPAWKWWQGEFHGFTGAHYEPLPESYITGWAYGETKNAQYVVPSDDEDGEELKWWNPTTMKVNNLLHALGNGVIQHYGEPTTTLALSNGVLEPTTRVLSAHSPEVFALSSAPYAYDADATCPAWLAFLEQVFPQEPDAQMFLQEWFGYVLSGRTDHQKIACLIGERRSGKGTVARVLDYLLGKGATTGTSFRQMGERFGLQALIGKKLAVSSDERWNAASITSMENILKITGEDRIDVDRKNMPAWVGRLPVRFMLISNEVPKFPDRAQAMTARLISLRFRHSMEGREDIGLEQKLTAESAGILNWALAGLDRLNAAGRFTVPAASQEIRAEVEENSNDVLSFVADCMVESATGEESVNDIYTAYLRWCRARNALHPTPVEVFGREIRKIPGVATAGQRRVNGTRHRFISGYQLSPELRPDAFQSASQMWPGTR